MAYTRRHTELDATWARAWTADALADLATIAALGFGGPRHGDVAYVTATSTYYLWLDNGTWVPLPGPGAVAAPVGPMGWPGGETDVDDAIASAPLMGPPGPGFGLDHVAFTDRLNTFSKSQLIGNLANPTGTWNVATSGAGFEGADWIVWFRRQSSEDPCESTFRHQHFSGGSAVIPQPIFAGLAARGTVASPLPVKAGDYLLILDGRAYDGSANDYTEYAVGWSDTAAQIAMRAGSDWSGTNHESYVSIKTVPNASTTPVERFRIASTGFIGHLGYASNPFASFVAASDADYSIVPDSFNSVSASTCANITARRARGSQASPTAALNGDTLFSFQARGYGASGFLSNAAAALNFLAAENYDGTHSGGEIHFQTTPLASVTAADVLVLGSSGAITAVKQPRVGVFHSTTQSVNDNAATAVLFDSEDFDVGAMHSTSSNTSRLVVPTGGDGVYLAIGQVAFAANALGQRAAILKKNGTTELCYALVPNAGVGIAPIVQVQQVVALVGADYIEVLAYQNSGGALLVGSATKQIANQAQLIKLW